MEKKLYINQLEIGQKINTPFLVQNVTTHQSNRGTNYLNFSLTDKTGKVNAKVWNINNEINQNLISGSVSQIIGHVDSYKNITQIIVEEAKLLTGDSINWDYFLQSSQIASEEMLKEFWDIIESEFNDSDYKNIISTIFKKPEIEKLFFVMPAAKSFHHAYRYGLLEHTLSVCKLSIAFSAHYSNLLNKDLLLAAAFLHDLGKIWEFTQDASWDYSTQGRLLGHIFLTAQFIFKVANSDLKKFPQNKLELLQHLVISHHGEYEFGSPRKPHTLEALALHIADNLDAKMKAVETFLKEDLNQETGWTGYHRLLDNYFFKTDFLLENLEKKENKNNKKIEKEILEEKKLF